MRYLRHLIPRRFQKRQTPTLDIAPLTVVGLTTVGGPIRRVVVVSYTASPHGVTVDFEDYSYFLRRTQLR